MAVTARDQGNAPQLENGNLDHGNLAIDLLQLPGVRRLGDGVPTGAPVAPPAWTRAELAGRLCELAAGPDSVWPSGYVSANSSGNRATFSGHSPMISREGLRCLVRRVAAAIFVAGGSEDCPNVL